LQRFVQVRAERLAVEAVREIATAAFRTLASPWQRADRLAGSARKISGRELDLAQAT
jgi:hypothetical protein